MLVDSQCVVYRERRGWNFALVLEEQVQKYWVLSEKKERFYVSKEKVEFVLSFKKSIEGLDYEKAKEIRELHETFEKKSEQLPIADLYDLLKEESAIERSTLVELCFSEDFDSDSLVEKELLLTLAIEKEPVYFKARDSLYYPQPYEQIQKVLEHQQKIKENQKKKELERESAYEWLTVFLNASLAKNREKNRENKGTEKNREKSKEIQRTKPTKAVQKLLEPIKNWVLFPSDNQKKKEALDLLASLRSRNIELSLSIEPLFTLLKEVGILEKEEDLFLHRWNISKNHSQKLMELVQRVECLKEDREDLSSLYTVTIDEEGSLDLDDALSVEFLKGGEYRVGIHITDVSAWIEKGSKLDEEALKRSKTLYLPMENIPIFPRELSEYQMSLLAGEKRPAISFFFHLDSGLQTQDSQILVSWIRVNENLTYEKVHSIVESSGGEVVGEEEHLSKVCHALYQIACLWESNREMQGALQFNRPEVGFYYGQGGEICLREIPNNLKSQKIVRECMIYVNYYTACFCRDRNISAIYMVQEPVGSGMDSSKELLVEGKLKASEMSWLVQRHVSLGLEAYTQVTSPIRRYQDLVVQRQVLSFIGGARGLYSLEEVAFVISVLESQNRILKEVKEQSLRFWGLKYLKQEENRKFRARVLKELKPFRYLVELEEVLMSHELVSKEILNRDEEIEVSVESINPLLDRLVLGVL